MIVVTGARGFVGKYLIERLKSSNLTLSFTTSNKEALNRPGGESFCYLNLKDSESFNNLPEEIGTVIHLAARVPKRGERVSFREFMDINSVGLKKLLSAVKSRGCERFIYASTQMVIEKPFYLPVDEEHPLVPLSDYGREGASIMYKAWVCTNPDCGFNLRIDNGEISIGRSISASGK